jgi:hypothetical protein
MDDKEKMIKVEDAPITSSVVNKTFNNAKGSITLNYTLRTDIDTELKDFLLLLTVATKQVTEELLKFPRGARLDIFANMDPLRHN